MHKFYTKSFRTFVISFLLLGLLISKLHAQSFSQSELDLNGNDFAFGVTSLMYGPDGRLYVAEYPTGAIKIFSVQRNNATDYVVTAVETLNGIQTMADHNDDGTLHTEVNRQVTGLTVAGTAANPIIYVSSSDVRIGSGEGGGNGDVGLDTNSGVITRFTWNGGSWDVVDLVRGLPRSEENHATNGLEFTTINGTDYLIVASGGFTNAGSPSTNFVYTCEYALSGAVLSIDLDAINALPVLSDGGRNYIYDLPTLDDPSRANVNGITDPNTPGYDGVDINDPFGGNDGLNQAIVVPGGPVQIFSPGYRNTYDLVVTESGALYVTDNGANVGWGGFPVNEGGGSATNDYDPTEPGSEPPGSGNELIDNIDHLQLVTTNLQTYVPGSLYGGHPNPTRANPGGAGLYVAPNPSNNSGAVFRTLTYDPNGSTPGSTSNAAIALPANWPPVQIANTVEGDWRGPTVSNPDGPDDNPVAIWGTNTNGIDEYTASNFGGAMQGDLLAGHNGGNVRRAQLNASGGVQNLNQTFMSGIGGNALGITCNGDLEVFPGTVWAGTLNGKIVVFEPQDFTCIQPGELGYDANADYDNDGYTNQDEEDNGTDPCNGGSQPADFDKAAGAPLISDLNDLDDDADGISDALDPFQLGNPITNGSDAFAIPVNNDLFNDQQGLGGIFGLGMTGLMNNGNTAANWLDWLDDIDAGPNPNDVLGGAPGLMTSHMTSGTALGNTNTQEKGYQYGVQTNSSSGGFTVSGNLINLSGALQLYNNTQGVTNGELGHFIGDGTQSNYIKIVLTTAGITALQEINDVPQTPINVPISVANRPNNGIVFYFVVNPSNGQVVLEYAIDGGARQAIGTITAQGSILTSIQQSNQDLAVGFIGTSGTNGLELEGTWDFLNVIGEVPTISQQLPDITRAVSAPNESINLNNYFGDDNGTANLTYSVFQNSNPAVGAAIAGDNLNLTFPGAPETSNITIRATDNDTFFVDNSFTVTVTDAPIALYRVNSGGPQITAIDGGVDWEADTTASNSQYLAIAGTNQTFPSTNLPVDGSVDQSTTPLGIFASERYDGTAGAPNMTYSFPVPQSGNYEVRLYMANSFAGTSQPGTRIFDTEIEGVVLPLLNDLDIAGTYGDEIGTVISHTLKVTDGTLNVSFVHGVQENPLVNAIEVLDASEDDTPIYVNPIADQFNNPGQQLTGSLGVNAFGGDGNLQYSASGLPTGVTIEPTNGQIGGTIDPAAEANSPFNVTVTVNDSDGSNTDTTSISFNWVIGSSTWVDKNENENYTARHECSFVQAGDKFYLMGGRENAQTVDVYDYTTNTWVNLTASAPSEFNHFQATEYQGLIWVIGAFGDNGFPNEVPEEFIWAFDPATNDWIQGPQIPAARRRGSTGLVVQNNKFYIIGGNTDGHDGGYVPWFDEYDPATGVWTPLTDAPRARDHFSAAVIGNQLYLAGGRLSGGPGGVFAPTIAEVDVYDFGSNAWSTLPAGQNIPTPRGGASSVDFDNKLVVIGGEVETNPANTTGIALAVTEQYDPTTQLWTTLDDLNHARHGTQAITSGNGIFILGGSNQFGGGNQKNMEYLGADNPVGTPSASSNLSAPTDVIIADGASEDITLTVGNGNVGIFVTSMEINGPNAADFTITAGELTNQLLSANSSQTMTVGLGGTGANRSAVLTINYGNGESITVNLANFDNNLNITNPGTQNNNEGDVVSLQIQANAASNFSATGLPPTLTINPTTGLISGTVSAGGGNTGPFEEDNGLVVIEAESGALEPSWTETTLGGATGILAGSTNLFNQTGGTIPYEVTISTPGVYRFNWKSFYSGANPTEENDNWLRFPNNDDVWFFGFDGTPTDEASLIANVTSANPTDIVFPIGSSRVTPPTTPDGAGGNGYFKIFRSGGTSQVYDWQAKTGDFDPDNPDDLHSLDIYVWFVNSGTYTMEISERSAGHAIDKVALYKVDGINYSNAQLTAAPESNRSGAAGAAENSPYTVTVTATDNGNPPLTGNTQFTWFIGEVGDPIAIAEADPISGFIPLDVNFTGSNSTDDVGVASYLWDFKDGSPTVTDADPTHTFTTAGTYEVELTVTDTDGNESTTTVTVTASTPTSAGDILINSGGPSFTFGAEDWSQDIHFLGGDSSFSVTDPIANTANDQLYQTERAGINGTTVTYEIPVAAVGDYNVDLHFAEIFFGAPGFGAAGGAGSRVFNINIENGQVQVDNYDIYVEAGNAALTAVVERYEGITVNDGNLTITLTAVVENPKISGIAVYGTSPPVADAGADQTITLPTSSIVLNGTGTDPDGGAIVSYLWTQENGPGNATLVGETTADLTANDLIAGDYVFRLTVTDDEDTTGFDEVTVTVLAENGNMAPMAIATATPLSGDVPLEVTFTGSNSTDDVGVVTYAWDFKDGSTSSDADPIHTFTTVGTYEVELTVTDADDLTDTTTVTITVGAAGNEAPSAVAEATPTAGDAPLEVFFTGSNSTDDVGIVSYAWDFMDGATSSEADPSHIFTVDGLYNVQLTVTDAEGLLDTATVSIAVGDVGNLPPVAVIEVDLSSGGAPLLVNFTGSNSTDDFGVSSFAWEFGDGNTSTEVNPEHTYTVPDTYMASLTVTDADGLTNTATIDIIVTEGTEVSFALESNPPNPADGGVARIIVANLPSNVEVTDIRIFDVVGRFISGHSAEDIMIGNIYEVPISTYRDDIYMINIIMSDGESTLLKLLITN